MPNSIEEIANYNAARARVRSELRRQSFELPNSAVYAGYDAPSGYHLVLRNGEVRAADLLTSGGVAISDQIEHISDHADAIQRPRFELPSDRLKRIPRTFMAAIIPINYQYERWIPLSGASFSSYSKYKSWIAYKESGKEVANLYFPWKGTAVLDLDPAPLAFDGFVSFSTYQINVIFLSNVQRLIQVYIPTGTWIDTSAVSYPVTVHRQPRANYNAEGQDLEDSPYGYYGDTFTFTIDGSTIEQMEVTRQRDLINGSSLSYGSTFSLYTNQLTRGEAYYNYVQTSIFEPYNTLEIVPGLMKTYYQGKIYEFKQPKTVSELVQVKRLLTSRNYRIGSSRPIQFLVNPDQFNLPEDASIKNMFVYSAPGLPPYTQWINNNDNYSALDGNSLTFYQRQLNIPGPSSGAQFSTVRLNQIRFFGISRAG